MHNAYLTKSQLVERIVNRMIQMGLSIRHYIFDGHYFKEKFIKILDQKSKIGNQKNISDRLCRRCFVTVPSSSN